ncbi:MAG: hypothetical protein OXI67_04550, partial [Candidatus Poribacteria bacterium]|nr:hypothetical protein [Candidatus Poribacteria bacterium]
NQRRMRFWAFGGYESWRMPKAHSALGVPVWYSALVRKPHLPRCAYILGFYYKYFVRFLKSDYGIMIED